MVVKLLTLTNTTGGKTRVTRYVNSSGKERAIDILHITARIDYVWRDGVLVVPIITDEYGWTMPMALFVDGVNPISCVAISNDSGTYSFEGVGPISTTVNILPWTGGWPGLGVDTRLGGAGLCGAASSASRLTSDDPVVGHLHVSSDCSDVTPADINGVIAYLVLTTATPYLAVHVFISGLAYVTVFYSPIDICNLSEGMVLTNTLTGDGSPLTLEGFPDRTFINGGSGGTVTLNFCVEALVPSSCTYVHRFTVSYDCESDTFGTVTYAGLADYDPFHKENEWLIYSSTIDDTAVTCDFDFLICSTSTDQPETPSTDSVIKSQCNCSLTIVCGDDDEAHTHEHCEGTNESALPSTALLNLAGMAVLCTGDPDTSIICYEDTLNNATLDAIDANTMTGSEYQYDPFGNEALIETTLTWSASTGCWRLAIQIILSGRCGAVSTWYGIKSGGTPTGGYTRCQMTGCVDWPTSINVT